MPLLQTAAADPVHLVHVTAAPLTHMMDVSQRLLLTPGVRREDPPPLPLQN